MEISFLKNFSSDVRSEKVYRRFSGPIFHAPIASRKFQRPISHLQQALEIFHGRFVGGESASPKFFRPSAWQKLPLRFVSGPFLVETGR
jgi:hypothetical protein